MALRGRTEPFRRNTHAENHFHCHRGGRPHRAVRRAAQAQVILKASHQFPGGKGDVRDDTAATIAKEAKAANVGLDVQVYPGASLFKPNDQWNATANGQLDITLFPLDYASGKVPVFSATLMPGLIRSQDRAKRINDLQFMKDVRAEIEKRGVMVSVRRVVRWRHGVEGRLHP